MHQPMIAQTLAYRKSAYGFSLIEVAVVLSIVGLLIGGIWTVASTIIETQKITSAEKELMTISLNIIALMNGQGFSANDLAVGGPGFTTLMANAGIIPAQYVSGGIVTHPWYRGGLAVGPYNNRIVIYPMSASDFRIAFYSVPVDACINMIMKATNCIVGTTGCPTGLVVAVNTGTYIAPGTNGWQMTPAKAAGPTLCGANGPFTGTGASNSVEFDYSPM